MKILIISHTSIVREYRKRIETMALREPSFEIYLVTPRKWIEANREVEFQKNSASQVREIPLRTFNFFLKNRAHRNVCHFYPSLFQIIRKIKPDIIDVMEEPYSLVTWYTSLCSKLAGINPKMVFFTGQSVFKKYPFPFSLFEKKVLRMFDGAYPINKDAEKVLLEKGFYKTQVISLGADEKHFCFKPKKSSEEFSIGFAGALTQQKGIDLLLEAFMNFSEENPTWKLFIAGNGELLNSLKKRAGYLLNRRVFFEGILPHEKMPDFYQKLDLLVMPSITVPNVKEQFGRIIVEGILSGTLVIGSDCGEIPNILPEQDLVFRENSLKSLSDKIQEVKYNYVAFQKKKVNYRAHIKTLYSWDSIAKLHLQLYSRILEGKL